MAWCFSTRASVVTVLTTHPCVSRCLRVKKNKNMCFSIYQKVVSRWYITRVTWALIKYIDRLSRYGIPMLKIRRSWYRLIFNMGIPILVRGHLHIETAPRSWWKKIIQMLYLCMNFTFIISNALNFWRNMLLLKRNNHDAFSTPGTYAVSLTQP